MRTAVPRFAASLLLALTGLMALLPQAMCPCSTIARSNPVKAVTATAGRANEPGCCPLCRARGRLTKQVTGEERAPQAPVPCPCCRMNGQGKTLVLLGAVVRPEPLLVVAFALPAPVAELVDVAGAPAGREATPDVVAEPPNERRVGVVLLI